MDPRARSGSRSSIQPFDVASRKPKTGGHFSARCCGHDSDRYDTRHVVYRPAKLTPQALEAGYHRAYRDFYSWRNIVAAARTHESAKHRAKHLGYAAGWKKFELLWDLAIKARRLALMTPLLEAVLSRVTRGQGGGAEADRGQHLDSAAE